MTQALDSLIDKILSELDEFVKTERVETMHRLEKNLERDINKAFDVFKAQCLSAGPPAGRKRRSDPDAP